MSTATFDKFRGRLNGFCGYYTPVNLHIFDWRLGVLNYTMIAVVFFYVIIYNIWYRGDYLLRENPVGAVRFSFREPTYSSTLQMSACDPFDSPCEANFRSLDELPYCLQGKSKGNVSKVLPCTYFDAIEATMPLETSALLATRVTQFDQERSCNAMRDPSITTCKHVWSNTGPEKNYFIADVESFTVLLAHEGLAPTLGVAVSSYDWFGALATSNKHLCKSHPNRSKFEPVPGEPIIPSTEAPCFIIPNATFPPSGLSSFHMSTLLQAANIDLDSSSDIPGKSHHSIRYAGLILVVRIEYSNQPPL